MTKPPHKRYRKYNVHETHTGFAMKSFIVFLCGLFVFALGVNAFIVLNDWMQGVAFVGIGFFLMLPMVWKVFSMILK